MFKLGDRVYDLTGADGKKLPATIIGLPYTHSSYLFKDHYQISHYGSIEGKQTGLALEHELELMDMKSETTTAEHEQQETEKIVELLEEAVWYENKPKRTPRSKSGDTIAALIQVLVGKGLISSQDVTRILNLKK